MSIFERDLISEAKSAYFIGIGGVGMSALARVLKHRGLEVAGSDSHAGYMTHQLEEDGIHVDIGQTQVHLQNYDLIIYSSAISEDNIELKFARQMGKLVFHRAELLSSLLNSAPTSIAVTGTHGKTTTSSMISYLLTEIGKNPTCLVGSNMVNFGSNAVLGNSELWVAEVDESDKSHRLYAPNYTIVTNLEEDHLDNYKDLEDLKASFRDYFANVRNPGLIVYREDDPVLARLVQESGKPKLSFGFFNTADISAHNIQWDSYGSEFDLYETGFYSARMKLSVPGLHNVANALAAIAVLLQLGIEPHEIRGPLSRFRGAKRRLEIKWESPDLVIIDDYAHHPTEVRASLKALRGMGKTVRVIFQPHRYSRTLHFFKQFGSAFEEADEVLLTDIYGAGEANAQGIDSNLIYDEVVKSGHPNARCVRKGEILDFLANRSFHNDIVAFFGAGDIGDIADEFANRHKVLAQAAS